MPIDLKEYEGISIDDDTYDQYKITVNQYDIDDSTFNFLSKKHNLDTLYVLHGTNSLDAILQEGFNPYCSIGKVNRWGYGCYFTPQLSMAKTYGNRIVLCKILDWPSEIGRPRLIPRNNVNLTNLTKTIYAVNNTLSILPIGEVIMTKKTKNVSTQSITAATNVTELSKPNVNISFKSLKQKQQARKLMLKIQRNQQKVNHIDTVLAERSLHKKATDKLLKRIQTTERATVTMNGRKRKKTSYDAFYAPLHKKRKIDHKQLPSDTFNWQINSSSTNQGNVISSSLRSDHGTASKGWNHNPPNTVYTKPIPPSLTAREEAVQSHQDKLKSFVFGHHNQNTNKQRTGMDIQTTRSRSEKERIHKKKLNHDQTHSQNNSDGGNDNVNGMWSAYEPVFVSNLNEYSFQNMAPTPPILPIASVSADGNMSGKGMVLNDECVNNAMSNMSGYNVNSMSNVNYMANECTNQIHKITGDDNNKNEITAVNDSEIGSGHYPNEVAIKQWIDSSDIQQTIRNKSKNVVLAIKKARMGMIKEILSSHDIQSSVQKHQTDPKLQTIRNAVIIIAEGQLQIKENANCRVIWLKAKKKGRHPKGVIEKRFETINANPKCNLMTYEYTLNAKNQIVSIY
eukprot:274952_1